MMVHRRALLTGFFASACAPAVGTVSPTTVPAGENSIEAIEQRLAGRVGLFAIDTGSGQSLAHRQDERFAMCSTFKAPLAGCILARVDRGELELGKRVEFAQHAILEHAPVTQQALKDQAGATADQPPATASLTVAQLCAAAVVVSDNTAANLLLEQIGGPAGFTAYLRSIGDTTTRLDRNEPALNNHIPGDPRDTTTPEAMNQTFRTLLLGSALKDASKEQLAAWLVECSTGKARLRAGLPAGWRAGDKTGTSGKGAVNDIAIAWPPDRPPIVIACYLDAAKAKPDELNAAHAEIASIVVKIFG